MEWIPVFSLIVLVATIGTFIMSVSAYVMFKIRERRKQARVPRRTAHVDAEIVSPDGPAPSQATAPQYAGQTRGTGQRLVQYTPPAYNDNQRKDKEPVAWR
jgi:hypothetical protein